MHVASIILRQGLGSTRRYSKLAAGTLDVRLIAAMGERSGVIGVDGQLPWTVPEDREYFMRLTTGHVLIMGRKSYLEAGHALPGRHTIVVSSTIDSLPDAVVARSLPEALEAAQALPPLQGTQPGPLITWIAGGTGLYKEACRLTGVHAASLLYLTLVPEASYAPAGSKLGGERAYFPGDWARHYPHLLAHWHGTQTPRPHSTPCLFTIWAKA